MEEIFHGAKKLGFGLMRLPLMDKNDNKSIDIEQMKSMVDVFLQRGFTYFDTAWLYHGFQSEPAVKAALTSRYPREAYTLATKLHSGYIPTPSDCDKVLNAQLEKMGVDYIDYYLLHDVRNGTLPVFEDRNCFEWIQQKKAEGKVRHIGFSYHDGPELLEQLLKEHPETEFVQLQLNYLDYNSPNVQSMRNYEVATAYHVPVVVMEPVKGGTLMRLPTAAEKLIDSECPGQTPASLAIRFAADHENVKMVLSGMNTLRQMEENTSFMQDFQPLNGEEKDTLNKIRELLAEMDSIPCTGCSYCTEGCPMNIPIPKYFSLYNAELHENPQLTPRWTSQDNYYNVLAKNFGKASDCVECGQCETSCPQQLQITEWLKKISKRFD